MTSACLRERTARVPTAEVKKVDDVSVFDNSEFGSVRTLTLSEAPWFVGKDVAQALGYEKPDNAIRNHVDNEDRLTHQISALGQTRRMIVINESGLYSLILASKLPNAKAFKRWVTSEVLPAIRKTGKYAVHENQQQLSPVNQTIELRREPRNSPDGIVIRINADAADIIEQLATETRKPISRVASELIIGAYPMIKIIG